LDLRTDTERSIQLKGYKLTDMDHLAKDRGTKNTLKRSENASDKISEALQIYYLSFLSICTPSNRTCLVFK